MPTEGLSGGATREQAREVATGDTPNRANRLAYAAPPACGYRPPAVPPADPETRPMSIEARLKRLEAGVADMQPDVGVEWPPEGEPPLAPGWHPALSLFVMKWPDEPEWSATASDANR